MIDTFRLELWLLRRRRWLKEWAPMWGFVFGVAALVILAI